MPVADSAQIRERLARRRRTRLPHLEDMRQTPAVVVLGERGCGKSVALEQEHAQLDAAGVPVTFLHLGRDFFDVTSAATRLEQALRTSLEVGTRFLLLDGLDEGLSDIPGLDKALLHHLQALSEPERLGLRLRIACRTTRWSAAMETGLRTLWPGDDQLAVMTLAPLTRSALQTAAEQHALDGANFLAQVTNRNLEALALQPVTLIPLLQAHARGEALPATVADAYAQACRTLCTETREESFTRRQERPAVDHLLAVARWVAAAMQFSRCAALVDGPQTGEGELDLDTLAAPGIPGLVPAQACGRRELLHLTESGLLNPVGQRRWVFAHRSFQEYLAAEFLSTSRISPTVLKELLWVGDGRARHIVPEHEEIAARLAACDEQLFEDLLAHDLPVLLLADLHALPGRQRTRVTQAFLDSAPTHDLGPIGWQRLDRVNHPGLAAQLRPFLTSGADRDQQYSALRIAAVCRPAGLAPALLDVAEDRAQPLPIRSLALQALDQVDDATANRLLLLATDPAASVAEEALARLWPQRVSATEYLDLLPDPDPLGFYAIFDKTASMMNPERAADLLDWSIRTLHAYVAKSAWAADLVAQAIAYLAQTDPGGTLRPLEEKVGQALVALADQSKHTNDTGVPIAIEGLKAVLADAPALRRRLVGYVLHHSAPDDILQFAYAAPRLGVFPEDDLLYWLTRWPDLPDEARCALGPLISHRPRPDDPRLRQAVDRALQIDPALREATSWWDAPEPQWLTYQREREAQQRRQHTFDKGLLGAALQAVCEAGPHTVRQAWHTVLEHLYRTADGAEVTPTAWLDAVAAAPSIPPHGSDLHHGLVTAARHVLITAPLVRAEDIPAWRTGYHQLPELSALGFLSQTTADATVAQPERWAGWALALATMTDPAEDTELRYALLRHCAHRAPEAFLTAVEDRLQRMPFRLDELTETLTSGSLHEAIEAVYRWAIMLGQPSESQADVLGVLARRGHLQARAQLADVVSAGPHGGPERKRRWIRAVLILMSCDNLTGIWATVRQQLSDYALFAELTHQMNNGPGQRGDWPEGVTGLTEPDLADLYVRMTERPELQRPRPEHDPGVPYTITRDETLHDLADALPRLIADKATAAAADELDRLSQTTARDPRHLARLAQRTARQAARQPLKPLPAHQLRQLADDRSLRVVADETQLLDVVMEALDLVQEALSGPNGLAILLWSRSAPAASSSMWPMWEEDFSDLVAGLLKIHLSKRRVILNREVQIDRPGAGGGRTDIHIQAATNPEDPEPFTVIIECKACWNPTLNTALADQLVTRYLRRSRTAGIFLVGFFDCDLWNNQHRPRCSPRHSRQTIEKEQQAHATRDDATVRARVLDCRPPGVQTN